MTGGRRGPARSAARVGLGAVVMAFALASCTAVSAAGKADDALTDRGFVDVSVQPKPMRDATLLAVSYRTTAQDLTALTTEYDEVAKIVWLNAPMRFDAVDISAKDAPDACTSSCRVRFDRAQLTATHGARDSALDRDARTELLGAAGALVALVAAALAMTVIAISKARRRSPRPWAVTPPGWAPRPGSSPAGIPRPGSPPPAIGYEPPRSPGGSPDPPAQAAPWPPQTAAPWPPQTPPPAYEPPSPPLVVPTHDIWARPPS
ncbi:MAG: hypothetical protein ABIM89_03355 [Mycobacteriales bacterium]